jgi:putative ATPase
MDLFEAGSERERFEAASLATRMRPRTLDELLGQDHIVGPGTLLRKAIERDQLFSIILWGPPGCGKTSLAAVVARATAARFEPMSAVLAGVADIRRVAEEAERALTMHGRRTIVFIDEIHRLHKGQQDAFLPHVENGTFILIGATTENPYFEIIGPLRSRCRVFRMMPLEKAHVRALLERALADPERGLGAVRIEVTPEAMDHFVEACGGDVRSALNGLEAAVQATAPDAGGVRHIALPAAEEAMQQKAMRYDRAGDEHYDTISAYIKSMRGSDPDAALYWLAKMLEAGEDPRFIARRLVIQAAEDVGNADPRALVVATAAAQAVEFVGMPEAQIPLAQATVYLATAPKSNASYLAIERARQAVREGPPAQVPPHLRRTWPAEQVPDEKAAYKYPHDYPGALVPQQYRPEGTEGQKYYEPTDRGFEAEIRRRLEAWQEALRGQVPPPEGEK